MKRIILILLVLLGLTVLSGSAVWELLGGVSRLTIEGTATPIRAVKSESPGWRYYGGDAGGSRYSSARQINTDNVTQLEVAWQHHSGTFMGRESQRGRAAHQSTPILAEDSLYYCTQFNEIIALNPENGEEQWRYDAKVPVDSRPANQYTCRGVSYWQDTRNTSESRACTSRILMGTVDARLVAVDARSGQPCSEFGDAGQVQIEPSLALRWPGEFQITSAPVIVGDIVITGLSIGDNLRAEAPLGTVHAFDIRNGRPLWQFNPVPQNTDDPARADWASDSADRVGHANVWTTMSVDKQRNLVFLPTSSPAPDFFGGHRAGDNRYANSVVALNASSGEIVWHYQIVHHDVWDYDLPAQPSLVQVARDGQLHDVVVQVTKMGLVFVLDRDTGQPFLPIEERAVPQNGVEGEVLSPTQPIPLNTPAVVPDKLDPDDAFGLFFWDKHNCKSQFNALRNEGLYTPPSVEGTLFYPFTGGGANWGSAAFDPGRNLLVVNMSNMAHKITLHPQVENREQITHLDHDTEFSPMEGTPYGVTRSLILSPLGLPCTPPPWGVLAGIDLASGEIVWRRPLGTTEDLAPVPLALPFGTPNFGGPIITAGNLIFIGATMDDYLRAFDINNGKELWKGRLPAGGQATPMTYEISGRQFVVIAAGGHGRSGTRTGDALVAFALPEE